MFVRLEEAGATNGEAERASRKKPVDVARRDAGESRAIPAPLVIANDMAAAQAWNLGISKLKRQYQGAVVKAAHVGGAVPLRQKKEDVEILG
jgi:hypothetical protein